jgi:hypothetical protein
MLPAWLNNIFGSLGGSLQGQAQAAADAATQAFYVLAGEMLVIIFLLIAILLIGVFGK